MCQNGVGLSYTGSVNTTISGKQCELWDDIHPWYLNAEEIPEKDFTQAINYCRNPYGEVCGPICFTDARTYEMECCHIESCGKCTCVLQLYVKSGDMLLALYQTINNQLVYQIYTIVECSCNALY